MLLSRDAIAAVVGQLEPDDFYKPAHGHVFAAIAAMQAHGAFDDATRPEEVIVADELRRQGLLDAAGGAAALRSLIAGTPSTTNAPRYATIVRKAATVRRLMADASEIIEAGYRMQDPAETSDVDKAVTMLADRLDTVTMNTGAHASTLEEFLATPEPEYDWLVPGLLERGDRLILTAHKEGTGKTTLTRQLCVTTSAGLHPFTFEPIAPLRVLLVDCENSRLQSRRKLSPMKTKVGDALEGRMFVECRPAGIDLLDPDDAGWLTSLAIEVQPDLIAIGPLYKLSTGDPDREKDNLPIARRFDAIRTRLGCAIWIEAHTPHGEDERKRPKRPNGWSGWRRWPEFGVWLGEDGTVEHWRGERDERSWPAKLRRGGSWPWTIDDGSGPTPLRAAVLGVFEERAGLELNQGQALDAVRQAGHKFDDKAVRKMCEELAAVGVLRRRKGSHNAWIYSLEAGFTEDEERVHEDF